MSGLGVTLVAILGVWMMACIWCGFRVRFGLFAGVLIVGLVMNMAWMMIGLDAHPLEPDALIAQTSVALCGFSSFGLGWFAGRVSRAWRESAAS